MNGSYAHAKTDAERIAIATVAANYLYFRMHPQGVLPGYGFYEEYLGPFMESMRLQAKLEALHDPSLREGIANVEREWSRKLMEVNALIMERQSR